MESKRSGRKKHKRSKNEFWATKIIAQLEGAQFQNHKVEQSSQFSYPTRKWMLTFVKLSVCSGFHFGLDLVHLGSWTETGPTFFQISVGDRPRHTVIINSTKSHQSRSSERRTDCTMFLHPSVATRKEDFFPLFAGKMMFLQFYSQLRSPPDSFPHTSIDSMLQNPSVILPLRFAPFNL